MQYRKIKANSTDVSVIVRVVDETLGTPETGVAYNTAGIALEYRREGAASTAITEVTQTASGAHSDGGFVHIGNGYCRLDLPDAAVAAGVSGCLVHGTITGMIVIGAYIDLEANDIADVYARIGAPAGASVSADVAAVKVDTAAILVDTGTTLDARIPAALVSGRMDASVGAMAANVMTAAAAAADLTTELQAGVAMAADLVMVAGYLDTEIAAILADTNELQTDWVNGGRLDLILDARASQTSVDTVDTVVDAILVDTAEIGAAGAGLTVLATAAALDTVDNFLDTEIAAIKAKTDQLVFTVANELDVNIQSVNGAAVTGDGNASPWDGA